MFSAPFFKDRGEAGRRLAEVLTARYGHRQDVVVLALPRGGVPVGGEVARMLGAPFDLLLVRKLGVPGREELAMGAISSGTLILDRNLIAALSIPQAQIDFVIAHEQRELERRERAYRENRPPPPIRLRTVILVDDGIATGSTMKAAIEAVRHQEPSQVVVATPVAPAETCRDLEHVADEVVCLACPDPFHAISPYYQDFGAVTDDEVRGCMREFRQDFSAV